ncbi:hypothetical protein HEP87_57520 [Streptomyces sp. S1D4-11]
MSIGQLVRDLVVGAVDELGTMPCAPVRVLGQHLRHGGVGGLSADRGLRLRHRESDHGMQEAQCRPVESYQRCRDRAVESVHLDSAPCQDGGGRQDLREVSDLVDGRDQQGVPSLHRQLAEPGRERRRQCRAHRQVGPRTRRPCRAPRCGEFNQRERVAERLPEYPLPNGRRQRGRMTGQQPPR